MAKAPLFFGDPFALNCVSGMHPKPNPTSPDDAENVMSKGMNQKKDTKKKPEKTLKEKRDAKAEKKSSKS